MAENIQNIVIEWLKRQKGWQTELAYRILDHDIAESDIEEIVAMVKAQSACIDKQFPTVMAGMGNAHDSLQLCEISGIRNIEGLAPRNPLKFDSGKNLFVVYGANGSGKSSYTRIIKRMCGTSHAVPLKPNVFKSESGLGECAVSFNLNGETKTVQWKCSNDAIPELSSIDVFDSDVGRIYLQGANPSTYTPRIIALFNELARCYGLVAQQLQSEKNSFVSKLPRMPAEYSSTHVASIYKSISVDSTDETLKVILEFTKSDLEKLVSIQARISETSPAKKAVEIRTHKKSVLQIADDLEKALAKVNTDSRNKFYSLQDLAIAKRTTANESVSVLEEKSELPAVGSPVWKELWEAAKKYSEEEVYKEKPFPYIGDDARCVLCHQRLDGDAKDRFKAFLDYICGTIESAATKAEACVSEIIGTLPVVPLKEHIALVVSAAHLDTEWISKLESSWAIIDGLKNLFFVRHKNENSSDDSKDEHGLANQVQLVIATLRKVATNYEQQAVIYDADAKCFDRQKAQLEVNELLARKWCSEQKLAILEEISRQKKVAAYDSWISQCRTNAVTNKAGEIANAIITTEYLRRFNSELKKLHAGQLRVSISSSNNKGVVRHSLSLKGTASSITPSSVLSEGECRIVSLAAFLADVTANASASPFIFDDPICSLDQEFEESVVDRLVELSKTRQVIVFTHRLSVLGMLNEKAEAVQILCARTQPWGSGEIGDTPLFAKKTQKALKALKGEFLSRARKAYQNGYEEYYPLGKQLCSDIRILVERCVELDLLADVVQRYRRAVNTLGKIQNLTRIKKEDCDLIDDFMTRYSRFEHSQPMESPVVIPAPDEIERDIDKLIAWQQEFSKRVPQS